jgi:hypothetical protein
MALGASGSAAARHAVDQIGGFETGIKIIDVLAPPERGGSAGLFGGAGVGKTVQIPKLGLGSIHASCDVPERTAMLVRFRDPDPSLFHFSCRVAAKIVERSFAVPNRHMHVADAGTMSHGLDHHLLVCSYR